MANQKQSSSTPDSTLRSHPSTGEADAPVSSSSEFEQIREQTCSLDNALSKSASDEQPIGTASGDAHQKDDEALEALREIVIGQYRDRVHDLQGELRQIEHTLVRLDERINDKDAFIQIIAPVLTDSIRKSIRTSRVEMIDALNPIIASTIKSSVGASKDEMIEALYPITGRLVQKSVAEAMRDLARRIDAQMRKAVSIGAIMRRIKARIRGIDGAELAMRELLPFDVSDAFLIHHETGILLHHIASLPKENAAADNDIIGGMLTAIGDFVQDAFGTLDEENKLGEIEYGGRRILIESGRYSYIAVVIAGIEPSGFRARMRACIYNVERQNAQNLRSFAGNVSALHGVRPELERIMLTTPHNASQFGISGHSSAISPPQLASRHGSSLQNDYPTWVEPLAFLGGVVLVVGLIIAMLFIYY